MFVTIRVIAHSHLGGGGGGSVQYVSVENPGFDKGRGTT